MKARRCIILLFLFGTIALNDDPVVAFFLPPGYRGYDAVVERLEEIVLEHGTISRIEKIGESVQGRKLLAIKISDNPALEEENEPDVLYVAEHHAREVITVEVAMGWISYLLQNYEKDYEITKLVNTREIWVVPMVNPDGLAMMEGGNLNQRKNARGVDLNRNYPFMWGFDDTGSDKNPTDETYRGPFPLSEPETEAMKNFVENHHFVTCISWHSGDELILYPWGYVIEDTKDDSLYRAIASQMSEASGYAYGNAKSRVIYRVNGELTDWLYGQHHVLAFTVEVYGGGSDDVFRFFNPDSGGISSVVDRNMESARIVAEIADNPPKAFLPLKFPQKTAYAKNGIAVFFGSVKNLHPEKQSLVFETEPLLDASVYPESMVLLPQESTNIKVRARPNFPENDSLEILVHSRDNPQIKNGTSLFIKNSDRRPLFFILALMILFAIALGFSVVRR